MTDEVIMNNRPENVTDKILQLPPLTDVMYHACRGIEFYFGSGEDIFTGSLSDECLDEIWDNINTALRCAGITVG